MAGSSDMFSFTGRGIAQARVAELLDEIGEPDLRTSLVPRSPLGRWTVRVTLPGSDASSCSALIARLTAEPSVELAIARPPGIYVRPDSRTLERWVVEAYSSGDPLAGAEGCGARVDVRSRPAADPAGLDAARVEAVARAVRAFLEGRGFEVSAAAEVALTVGTEDGHGGVYVGPVDVRHGRLRARHGGSLERGDLERELGGSGALRFALLRAGRRQRLGVDEERVDRDRRAFGRLSAVISRPTSAETPSTRLEPAAGPCSQPELLSALDALPAVAARAAASFEPVGLLRTACEVADRFLSSRGEGGADSSLARVVPRALALTLSHCGLDAADRGEPTALPTPPAPGAGDRRALLGGDHVAISR